DSIVRWTANAEGVRRIVLSASPREVRGTVETVLGLLTEDRRTSAEPSAALQEHLESLARTLLPTNAFDEPAPGGISRVLVSADGFLDALPFEILDLDAGSGYRPLLDGWDVASLRFRSEAPRERGGDRRSLIVVDPDLSPELKRRYPFLHGLPHGRKEAQAVVALIPDARLLEGAAATKTAVTARWEAAPVFYATAHVVRNPESPITSFLPLAGATGGPAAAEEAYLDVADIRGADLSGCELVVLSACASGAPYVTPGNAAPSLGDAFLDSGAAAVVQTLWDIRDEEARIVMERFLESWQEDPRDPARALCAARRRVRRDSPALRHPAAWGSYVVKLGRVPPGRNETAVSVSQ
ncbi:MAG TPA: CHAT domain-containing protein, partial [bacterium]|nr:CHAT domain-containing protein [bacterium]